jgi:hypothetical protein
MPPLKPDPLREKTIYCYGPSTVVDRLHHFLNAISSRRKATVVSSKEWSERQHANRSHKTAHSGIDLTQPIAEIILGEIKATNPDVVIISKPNLSSEAPDTGLAPTLWLIDQLKGRTNHVLVCDSNSPRTTRDKITAAGASFIPQMDPASIETELLNMLGGQKGAAARL